MHAREKVYAKYDKMAVGLTVIFRNGIRICPAFANSVDPDQLASEEAK